VPEKKKKTVSGELKMIINDREEEKIGLKGIERAPR
jgi:hypothetical protein